MYFTFNFYYIINLDVSFLSQCRNVYTRVLHFVYNVGVKSIFLHVAIVILSIAQLRVYGITRLFSIFNSILSLYVLFYKDIFEDSQYLAYTIKKLTRLR